MGPYESCLEALGLSELAHDKKNRYPQPGLPSSNFDMATKNQQHIIYIYLGKL